MSQNPGESASATTKACADSLPCSFAQFLVSLGSSAMVHLGEAPDPDGQTRKDLGLASHTLNVLRVLQTKTRGNLDEDERKLLDALVNEIKNRYEAAAGRPAPDPCGQQA